MVRERKGWEKINLLTIDLSPERESRREKKGDRRRRPVITKP